MTSKIAAAAAAAVAALSLTACGSKSGDDPAVGAPAETTAAAGPATSSAAGDDNGCGTDALDAVKRAVTSTAVQKIQVIGGCSMVSIETSLDPTARDAGMKICQDAAKVAYSGSVMSVSVDGTDGHELAAGIKGGGCI
jgi:hypothetical protein